MVEVADTSLSYDLCPKLGANALAGVPEVWVIDVIRRRVLRFRRQDFHHEIGRTLYQVLNISHIHIICENVKNITLSVDEATYRAAKIAAAERGQSVSALVRDLLRNLSGHAHPGAKEPEALFAAMNRAKNRKPVGRLRREELYDR